MRSALGQGSPLARLPARLRPGGFTLFVVGAAALGTGLVLARQVGYGVGLSWDSVNYIGVARNLLAGEGFVELTGRVYALWAPLYPLALAAGGAVGIDPQAGAGPLNAAAFGAAVIVSGLWLRDRLESRYLAVGGVLGIALSLPMAWAASFALATMALSLFTLLALIHAERFLAKGRKRALVWAGAFSALAWLTHYTGAALPVAVAGLILLRPGVPFGAKARQCVVYGLISAAPMALWALSVLVRTGEFTANRLPIRYSVPELGWETAVSISKWAFVNLFVESRYGEDARWALASLLAACALLAFSAATARLLARAALDRKRGEDVWARWGALFTFGGFALTFFGMYLTALTLGSSWDGIQDRHLIPAYLPLLIAAIAAMDKFFISNPEEGVSRGASVASAGPFFAWTPLSKRFFAGAALTLWLGLSLALAPTAIREANAYGVATYERPRFADSDTLAYVLENGISGDVYTNDVHAVYAHTRRQAPLLRAFELYYPRDPVTQDIDVVYHVPHELPLQRKSMLSGEGARVVWFHGLEKRAYDAADLRATRGLKLAAELADGAVFVVESAHDPLPTLRSTYEALAAREPAGSADYDVYFDEGALTYVRTPCSREDAAARFFLHVWPADAGDLPDERRGFGFDNLDFSFERSGVRFDETCMARAILPSYAIEEVATGQFRGGRRLWEAKFGVSR